MLKTYIGPYAEGVEVMIAGESFGLVKPGETLVIPDELGETVGWSDEIWQDGKPAKAAAKSATKKEDGD